MSGGGGGGGGGGRDIALVAILIAAYKEGVKIADRIRRNRVQRGGVAPPAELEKALRDGEVRISEVRDENSEVKVDMEAQMALKDLIIEVQGVLLRELVEAELDDSINDFAATIQMAVRTRRRAINVLNDLYQRAEDEAAEEGRRRQQALSQQQLPSQQLPSQQLPSQRLPSQQLPSQQLPSQQPSQQLPSQQPSQQLPSQQHLAETESQTSQEDSTPRQFWSMKGNTSQSAPSAATTNRFSFASEKEYNYNAAQDSPLSLQAQPYPPPGSSGSSGSPGHVFSGLPSPQTMMQQQQQQQQYSLSAGAAAPGTQMTPRSRSTWSTSSTGRTTTATSPVLAPITLVRPLNKTDNAGGFCRGAWYAQNLRLDKATGKASLRSYGWAFHCKKCNYRLAADVRDRNRPRFDDRIYHAQSLHFRLLFLLKSHLPVSGGGSSSGSKKSSNDAAHDQLARAYGCLLCALAGSPAKVCHGEDHLLEHVQRHARQTFGDVCLDGPVSIAPDGVHIESRSTFDICFGGDLGADLGGGAGSPQWLDGTEVDFALPPPAAMAVELDASEMRPR